MKTKPIFVYSYNVHVLLAGERSVRFRVVARNKEEAEEVGMQLARMAKLKPMLPEAVLDQTQFNQKGDRLLPADSLQSA
jgi:hypothetical protein